MRATAVACVTICLAATVLAQETPKKRILLVWEKTDFKEVLVEEMERLLAQRGCQVTKILHTKSGLDAEAADFDAVFITNSGVNSKVRPWITEWLAANKAQTARILLHTTQTSNWKVIANVDAVTSASSKGDVKAMAADYVARIGKILAPAGAK
jgi:MarR-like DNA-binding transcriptional regulator SgrR of sgrS sRNA